MPDYAMYIKPENGVLNYQIQRWRTGQSGYFTVAATPSIDIANAAFDAACALYPADEITLQCCARVLRERERP